jgi:DNA-binding CsgD family transcriptional regulator/tetratricopeptide (TPR) repeat protein
VPRGVRVNTLIERFQAPDALLERELELSTITRLLTEVAGGDGAHLVIEGPPGIGKSVLLRVTVRTARERNMRVLATAGHEVAPQIPFGVARDLLGTDSLSNGGGGGSGARDPHLIAARLVRNVLDYAASEPVVLAVDDVQWSDAASLRWLTMLARNLWQAPILLALAIRSGPATEGYGLDELLRELKGAVIRPAPLSSAAASQLLATRLGRAPTDQLAAACVEATGGNPFLLRTLADALRQAGPSRRTDHVSWVRDVGARALARTVTARLDALDREARVLAEAAAVLGDVGGAAAVGEIVGLDPAEALDAAGRLAAADLLSGSDRVEFSHPLVASAIRNAVGAATREQLQRETAARLAAAGRVEEAAARLAELPARGDHEAAEILARAASIARTHGAPDIAATLLRRALAEPPRAEREHELLAILGEVLLAVGDPEAVEVLAAALEPTTDPDQRADLAHKLSLALVFGLRIDEAKAVLERTAGELIAADPVLAGELEARTLYVAGFSPGPRRDRTIRLRELGERRGPSDFAHRMRLLGLAQVASDECAPASKVAALAEQALAGGTLLSHALDAHLAADSLLVQAGRTRQARAHLQDAMAAARARGETVLLSTSIALHGEAYRVDGALIAAEGDIRSALALAGDSNVVTPPIVCGLLEVLIERDEVVEAEDELRRSGLAGDLPDLVSKPLILYCRGGTRAAAGALREGLDDILLAGESMFEFGTDSPAAVPWRSRAATIMLELNEREAALELASSEVALAERIEAPRALGGALRVQGIALGGPEGAALLQRAVSVLERSHARLEYARALTDLGATLRLANEFTTARHRLHRAVELAEDLGATRLADRAGRELVRAGGRQRHRRGEGVAGLTPAERRVAGLAVQGLTNRQVAETLVVSTKTVETHLSSAFRKLHISTRDALSSALRDP